MADAPFYRLLTEDLAQGDIFEDVPHVHSRSPIEVVRQVDPQKTPGRRMFGLYPWPPKPGEPPALPKPGIVGGAFHIAPPSGELVASHCEVSRTIALNHECDLVVDQEPKYRLMAMVLPLATVQNRPVPTDAGEKLAHDVIRDGQNYFRFYLPAVSGVIEDSYVDLRRMSSVHPDFLVPKKRVASLSEDSFKALLRQLFLFLAHVELNAIPSVPSPTSA
jgi:hypothetical protein